MLTNKKDINKFLKSNEKQFKKSKKIHSFNHGKIEIISKCKINGFDDFSTLYTPGVASVCYDIFKNPESVYKYTNKSNSIVILSDGSRVLGLGDIGAEASIPVMEGKSLLYKYLGGVDAYPICLNTKNEEEIINFARLLQPSFSAINLEDIEQPKCFSILKILKKKCYIPVWHDDQHGTAIVVLAGLINSLKIVKKKINKIKIAMIGSGAANICILKFLIIYGANPDNIIMVDKNGILHKERFDLKSCSEHWEAVISTNIKNVHGGIKDAIDGTDVVISFSTPGPGIIKKEWIKLMRKKSIVFACANPIPEIWPWEAKGSGAIIVSTGRSDFCNQINNSLSFPGVIRGVLDVMATDISDSMCISAANELASCISEYKINENKILPDMNDWKIFPKIAAAVGMRAINDKISCKKFNYDDIYNNAMMIIKRSRTLIKKIL
jgi:malate dehydrogenase (oxaloacetate-decarboxylating)